MLAGALAGHPMTASLDGDASLRRRPMRRVATPLQEMGAAVRLSRDGTAPMIIDGRRPLRGITFEPPVASAQVKTAVLLAGLFADGPTTVVEPAPTRDHTERLLELCGVEVSRGEGRVTVSPGALQPFGLRIPGDISSAAFFLCLAAAREGWRVRCPEVGLNPGRDGVLEVLRAMGAAVEVTAGDAAGGVEPVGDVEVRGAGPPGHPDRRRAGAAAHRRAAGDRGARHPGGGGDRDPRRRRAAGQGVRTASPTWPPASTGWAPAARPWWTGSSSRARPG